MAKVADLTNSPLDNSSNSTHSFTLDTGAAVGNLVVVRGIIDINSISILSLDDTRGNTWSLDLSDSLDNLAFIASSVLTTALQVGDNVNVNLDNSAQFMGIISAFDSIAANPLDQGISFSSSSGSGWTSGLTGTTTQASELLIAVCVGESSGDLSTPTNGFIGEISQNSANQFHVLTAQYKIVSSVGAYNTTGDWDTGGNTYTAAMITYKMSSSTPAVPDRSRVKPGPTVIRGGKIRGGTIR